MGRRRAKSVTGPKGASAVEQHVRITRYNTNYTRYRGIQAEDTGCRHYTRTETERQRDRVPWIQSRRQHCRGSIRVWATMGGRFQKRVGIGCHHAATTLPLPRPPGHH